MQIGMFYQIQVPKPWTAQSESNRYWEMLEQVSFAEEMGLASVWLADHQFRTERTDFRNDRVYWIAVRCSGRGDASRCVVQWRDVYWNDDFVQAL